MHKTFFGLAVSLGALALAASPAAADPAAVKQAVAADYDSHLEDLFLHFHANPELSFLETETAKRMAAELRAAGLDVTEGVGGTGVVGMVRNGEGPLILLRADMDGLPLPEKTGLDYASTVTQTGQDGQEYPVMHACGHDVHITSMVGTARRLMAMRDQWAGTLMFIVQPAEERVGGAEAMLKDGLYDRFGKPDYALAFHVSSGLATGIRGYPVFEFGFGGDHGSWRGRPWRESAYGPRSGLYRLTDRHRAAIGRQPRNRAA